MKRYVCVFCICRSVAIFYYQQFRAKEAFAGRQLPEQRNGGEPWDFHRFGGNCTMTNVMKKQALISETRRSGIDRREGTEDPAGRRSGRDRRALLEEHPKYIGLIQKIPLFKSLKLAQFKKILRICSKQTVLKDRAIILDGEESKQFFILITGKLKVIFSDGKELSTIVPVEIVGEMGVFTGEKRSASVVATEESILLAIHRKELIELFRKDSEIGLSILMNVIRELSHKLKKSNMVIDGLRDLCFSGEYSQILKKTNKMMGE